MSASGWCLSVSGVRVVVFNRCRAQRLARGEILPPTPVEVCVGQERAVKLCRRLNAPVTVLCPADMVGVTPIGPPRSRPGASTTAN